MDITDNLEKYRHNETDYFMNKLEYITKAKDISTLGFKNSLKNQNISKSNDINERLLIHVD